MMRGCIGFVVILSIPVMLMVQVFQGYFYTVALEEAQELNEVQQSNLEENKKILAGISVYAAPERIFKIATQMLGLGYLKPEKRVLVNFPDKSEQTP